MRLVSISVDARVRYGFERLSWHGPRHGLGALLHDARLDHGIYSIDIA